MDKLKAYISGLRPDKLDIILGVVLVLYYFNILPPEFSNDVANLKNAALALLFKNVLPQHLNDLVNRK